METNRMLLPNQMKVGASQFFIHPRTPEEARDEFVSDLARHIDRLETRAKSTKNATEGGKIAYCLGELRLLHDFWSRVNIIRPQRRRNGEPSA